MTHPFLLMDEFRGGRHARLEDSLGHSWSVALHLRLEVCIYPVGL
ncbi:MAG: hypothetical protein RIS34_1475 [Pseudomonadota bacterium]|jgi:uncharacterized glyoxalase superfamily protein PhnB